MCVCVSFKCSTRILDTSTQLCLSPLSSCCPLTSLPHHYAQAKRAGSTQLHFYPSFVFLKSNPPPKIKDKPRDYFTFRAAATWAWRFSVSLCSSCAWQCYLGNEFLFFHKRVKISHQFLFVHDQIHSNHLKIINRFSSGVCVCVPVCVSLQVMYLGIQKCTTSKVCLRGSNLILRFRLELGLG